jgi:hypothetical protein
MRRKVKKTPVHNRECNSIIVGERFGEADFEDPSLEAKLKSF